MCYNVRNNFWSRRCRVQLPLPPKPGETRHFRVVITAKTECFKVRANISLNRMYPHFQQLKKSPVILRECLWDVWMCLVTESSWTYCTSLNTNSPVESVSCWRCAAGATVTETQAGVGDVWRAVLSTSHSTFKSKIFFFFFALTVAGLMALSAQCCRPRLVATRGKTSFFQTSCIVWHGNTKTIPQSSWVSLSDFVILQGVLHRLSVNVSNVCSVINLVAFMWTTSCGVLG